MERGDVVEACKFMDGITVNSNEYSLGIRYPDNKGTQFIHKSNTDNMDVSHSICLSLELELLTAGLHCHPVIPCSSCRLWKTGLQAEQWTPPTHSSEWKFPYPHWFLPMHMVTSLMKDGKCSWHGSLRQTWTDLKFMGSFSHSVSI